jgi:hypothetical protein
LGRAGAIAAVLSLLPLAAQAAPSCPGGGFVARAFAESVEPEVLVVGDDGRVSRLGSCTVKPRKGRRSWPLRARLTECEGTPTKVMLRGRWDGCNQLVVTLRGKKFRRNLNASRSRCGDGFIDTTSNEQCESASDCRAREDCGDDDCRCQDIDVLPGDDADCIPGTLEARLGLNRASPDTDGDGVDDGAEDLDGDGLLNCDEVARGTALDDVDTDHDGASDSEEVTAGTDPLTPVLRMLLPGEVVGGEITPTDRGDGYQFVLDADRRVIIRAVDASGSSAFTLCTATFDTEGKRRGPTRCGNIAHLSNDLPAGSYTISVWGEMANQSGEYRLQYLPLDDSLENAVPRTPDTFVDASLPGPFGLWNLHRFTVDSTRRVTVRIEAREILPGFQPCFAVLRTDGTQVQESNRCSAVRADRDVELTAGTYFVAVSDEEDTSTGPYRLRVLQFHADFARDLSSGVQCQTFDGWGEDFDLYRIDPEGSDQLMLTQTSNEEGFRPCLRVWDQNGTQLLPPPDENTCTGPTTVELPSAGYYASVHDDSRNATGSYCLAQP